MVLVTGGTGLVGAHLLLHLVENEDVVRAIYRNLESVQKTKNLFSLYKKETLFKKIEWIQADIIDIPSLEIAFQNIDYVYHCAALISFDPRDEDALRKTNIEGTANIVNFSLTNGVKKICFVSSIAALGDLKENENTITEETEWNPEKPHSDYAISKYGAEMEIWRGQQEGLNTVIINPGIILGAGFWEQGSGLLFKRIKNGFPFYTKGSTGIIAVDDVVQIAIKVMKNEISNERFILIAENMVFQELVNSVAAALNVKKPGVHANPFLINVLWRLDWFIATFFRKERKLDRATASASYSTALYSNEKIKKALETEFLGIHQYIKTISKLHS